MNYVRFFGNNLHLDVDVDVASIIIEKKNTEKVFYISSFINKFIEKNENFS